MHESARSAPLTKLDDIALYQLKTVMTEVKASYDNFEFYKGVAAINKWINADLSAFYLEAMKDRLYCGDGGGVLEDIFLGLMKMLAPITPNLVEESWAHRPEWMASADRASHPACRPFFDAPNRTTTSDKELKIDLDFITTITSAMNLAQEQARAKKLIGSSLESAIFLDLPSKMLPTYEKLAKELPAIFVVSSVDVCARGEEPVAEWKFEAKLCAAWAPDGEGFRVWVVPAKGAKCGRCWRVVASAEEVLCGRCEEAVKLLE